MDHPVFTEGGLKSVLFQGNTYVTLKNGVQDPAAVTLANLTTPKTCLNLSYLTTEGFDLTAVNEVYVNVMALPGF